MTNRGADMQKTIECKNLDEGMKQIRALNIPKGYNIRITIETDEERTTENDLPIQSILAIEPRKGRMDSTELIRKERERIDTRNSVQ